MDLYIDLMKAEGPSSAVGQNTNVSSQRRKRLVDESYNKHPVGVMGGDGKPDDPDVGPRHNHTTSLDDSLEDERKKYADKQDARNIIRTPKDDEEEEEETKKSLAFLECIADIVKSEDYNPVEREFLFQEMGYTSADLIKGIAPLSPSDRSRFGQWLDDRMQKSVLDLMESHLER